MALLCSKPHFDDPTRPPSDVTAAVVSSSLSASPLCCPVSSMLDSPARNSTATSGPPTRCCDVLCSQSCGSSTVTASSASSSSSSASRLGIFDIFKIGLGPSSSHTVGAMVAAGRFISTLKMTTLLFLTETVKVELFGSFALTGIGHSTDKAVVVGLTGAEPAIIDPDEADYIFDRMKKEHRILLAGLRDITFIPEMHMVFHYDEELPYHPNGLRLSSIAENGDILFCEEYLSIGGGFVKTAKEMMVSSEDTPASDDDSPSIPFTFSTAAELLHLCSVHSMTISEIMIENEIIRSKCTREEVMEKIDSLWRVMSSCIARGLTTSGPMPVSGILRLAQKIHQRLLSDPSSSDPFSVMDWVTLYARAVNEENACGGRVVTAPTNGASGTLPAVLKYYSEFLPAATQDGVRHFLATAAAFGVLLKSNASISGAEAGCQAEVGSACAMASAGLTAVMGGTPSQVENAAEIGLEHNLGLTCDPLLGLVQVPCIERNCVAAINAITASRLALKGDGYHEVSFDSCVETMYRTGIDMQAKYRETSAGGLAVFARKPGAPLDRRRSLRNTC